MNDYVDSVYSEQCAEAYDQWFGSYAEAAIDALAELAGRGRALELGIGTGLIALPLAARGVEVHGIDASAAMVSRLRAKPGGDSIPVSMGNFAQVGVDGTFSLIYIVYNTFFALRTQEDQVLCFRKAAEHLDTGGYFVLEAFVPDPQSFVRGQSIQTRSVTPDQV